MSKHDVAAAAERLDVLDDTFRFVCEWYGTEEIRRCIASHWRKVHDAVSLPKIPEDVRSQEFADWLCTQYRLAMMKGIDLARGAMQQRLSEHRADDDLFRDAANHRLRPCSCEAGDVHWIGPPSLFGVECWHCGVVVSGFEFKSTAALAWNLICGIESKYPDGISPLKPIEQQPLGEDAPEFGEGK